MALQNNYNFNGISKNQKFLVLVKQSKKAFSVNLLNKNPLNCQAISITTKFDTGTESSAIRATTATTGLSYNRYKQIQDSTGFSKREFLKSNWSQFLYNNRKTNTKQIQTRFRSIISDHKRRISFDNQELKSLLLKSLLCVTSGLPALQLNLNSPAKALWTWDKENSALKSKSSIGPGLILERSIYGQYIKKQGISKIRNRCIVTGRSSIIGKFRLSRISFRRYAGQGLIPGLAKGSH